MNVRKMIRKFKIALFVAVTLCGQSIAGGVRIVSFGIETYKPISVSDLIEKPTVICDLNKNGLINEMQSLSRKGPGKFSKLRVRALVREGSASMLVDADGYINRRRDRINLKVFLNLVENYSSAGCGGNLKKIILPQ
ncbi:hypothetical protein [Andreprevotia lacus]|jgi:hypothetical protein|uniref:hypothetical protein n=1 Tax=Andreprevotia lacus TaxID=1121000 RepID=UPI00111C8D0B|nr:hypothetical protein [Andreprevotia lacus]